MNHIGALLNILILFILFSYYLIQHFRINNPSHTGTDSDVLRYYSQAKTLSDLRTPV